ncbi:MAG: hypothetical protein LDL30_06725 [Desulfovibrio sp.]|nr:hypothetical protein [Desulfovibrio sp.]
MTASPLVHWSRQYLGRPWTTEQDCLWWFRFWSREHFGRDVPDTLVDHSRLVQSAARIMDDRPGVAAHFGYHPTDTPQEGDAVFLSQRRTPHHIGMWVLPGGEPHILQAVEQAGVICPDLLTCSVHGWQLKGFWTYGPL